MRYLIKGRDFVLDLCGLIDILKPFIDKMIRVQQALDQMVWTITILMPKVKAHLKAAESSLRVQLKNINITTLDSYGFPKLSKHYTSINKDDPRECVFKGVNLTEGWMVVNNDEDEPVEKYKWIDRTVQECLEEMLLFIEALLRNIDERMKKCVTQVAHNLGKCLFIPNFLKHMQGDSGILSAQMKVSLAMEGRQEFQDFD